MGMMIYKAVSDRLSVVFKYSWITSQVSRKKKGLWFIRKGTVSWERTAEQPAASSALEISCDAV